MELFLTNQTLKAIVFLAVCLILCFAGYQLQKLWVALLAFGAGFWLGDAVASYFTAHPAVILGCAIVCGCFFAGISFKLYLAGLFVAGIAAAVPVAAGLIENQWLALFAGVAVGVGFGMLVVKANRPVVICATGIFGGLAAGKQAAALLPLAPPLASVTAQIPSLPLVLGVVLAALGLLVQFRATRPHIS